MPESPLKRRAVLAAVIALVVAAAIAAPNVWPARMPDWTDEERAIMATLSITRLPETPPASGNAVANNDDAVRFGHALFFDPRLSGTGTVACITCHQPTRRFTDGLPTAIALGSSARHTPSIVGSAYSPWLYWDGRRDSLWSQALTPLEDAAEHGGNRAGYVRLVADDPDYREQYETLFGDLPDLGDETRFPVAASPLGTPAERVAWNAMATDDQHAINTAFANIGKALAAYEARLRPAPARFDRFVAAVERRDTNLQATIYTADEAQGLRLFLGKARCIECHNGPLFTNNEFHNTGILAAPGELPDRGRIDGLDRVREDPFNCRGRYNDDEDPYCGELEFARDGVELIGALRTPSLRNLADTAPYMHKGQLSSLEAVVDHYNKAPLAMIGHSEAEDPLSLRRRERRQLVLFLHTLDAPVENASLLVPPETGTVVMSGETRR